MNKWLIMENKYNGDGPYLDHVNAKEVMQEIGKEEPDIIPIEWTGILLTGRYMAPWIKGILSKWVTYPLQCPIHCN